jgi:hypothetical protein
MRGGAERGEVGGRRVGGELRTSFSFKVSYSALTFFSHSASFLA